MNINLRRVYFPLRSNAGWFQSENLRNRLEDRFKEAILLYDEIIVEDGAYEAFILDDITSEIYTPSTSLRNQDRSIVIERDIKNIGVSLWTQPQGPNTELVQLAGGLSHARFKIDYYDFLSQLEPTECNFITPSTISPNNLSNKIKSLIDQQAMQDFDLLSDIENNRHIKTFVAKNLNLDMVISSILGTSIIVDPTQTRLLKRKSRLSLQGTQFLPDTEHAIVRRLLEVRVPNLRNLSISEVVTLRQEKIWEAFRSNIRVISDTITSNPDILLDDVSFQEVVHDAIDQALFKELDKREKDGIQLVADMVLGGFSLIPGVGVGVTALSAIRSLADFHEQRNGWVAFLTKASRV